MKKIIFLLIFLSYVVSMDGQDGERLKLTVKTSADYTSPGNGHTFKLVLTNISDEPITVLSPNKIDVFWKGYTYTAYSVFEGKETVHKERFYMQFKKPKNEGLIELKAGESAEILEGGIDITQHGKHSFFVSYTQDPSAMREDYRKVLKKNYDRLSYFELQSDTIFYDNSVIIKELEAPITYEDLTFAEKQGSNTTVKYMEQSIAGVAMRSADVSNVVKLTIDLKRESDKKALYYLPYLRNVHWVTIKMDITDTIPDIVSNFKFLRGLEIDVTGNNVRKRAIHGFEQFKSLTDLQHLKLYHTFQSTNLEWIVNNTDMRSLDFSEAMDKMPAGMGAMTRLEKVNMQRYSGSYATELPQDFNKLTSLKYLRIYGDDFQFTHDFVKNNPNLENVFLNMTNVDLFPDFSDTNVVDLELDITKGDVSHYPKGVENMPKANRIILDGRFGNIEAPSFDRCISLTTFVIRDKKMTEAPASIFKLRERVPRTFIHAPNLHIPFNLPQ